MDGIHGQQTPGPGHTPYRSSRFAADSPAQEVRLCSHACCRSTCCQVGKYLEPSILLTRMLCMRLLLQDALAEEDGVLEPREPEGFERSAAGEGEGVAQQGLETADVGGAPAGPPAQAPEQAPAQAPEQAPEAQRAPTRVAAPEDAAAADALKARSLRIFFLFITDSLQCLLQA